MKKIVMIVCMLMVGLTQAQEVKPVFEKAGDLIKVTRFYKDGTVKEQGFYKNKKLTGTWVTYDAKGEKTAIAHYDNGKKVGKWFIWSANELKEIDYRNNVIASVQTWKENTKIAVK